MVAQRSPSLSPDLKGMLQWLLSGLTSHKDLYVLMLRFPGDLTSQNHMPMRRPPSGLADQIPLLTLWLPGGRTSQGHIAPSPSTGQEWMHSPSRSQDRGGMLKLCAGGLSG